MYQKARKLLFLVCLGLFVFLLPTILLFTFGYKIDWNTLRILKTGLIWVSSSPEGANVYLNGKFLDKRTPATIEELMPGTYTVSLLLEDYYPWQSDVEVQQGRVVSISKAMLFPRIAQFDKLNFEGSEKFFIFNQDKDFLYYIVKNTKTIHKVNAESGKIEGIFRAEIFPGQIENILLSPDKKKMLCFDSHNIAVVYLEKERFKKNFILQSRDRISQIFWHSDSEHFIVVTNKDIKIYELFSEGKDNTITIAKLLGRVRQAHYDLSNDTLFFLNQQEATDGKRYENIYKIIIGQRFSFPFSRGLKNK
jgi:hypothetical protein